MRHLKLLTLLLAALVIGCSAEKEPDLENFLQGKRLEYHLPMHALSAVDRGVMIDFVDTSLCFLTHFEDIKETRRVQPVKLVARWDVNEDTSGISISVRSQLRSFNIRMLSYDSSSCEILSSVMSSNKTLEGRIQDIRLSDEQYALRSKRLTGDWAGKNAEGPETIDLELTPTEAEIYRGNSTKGTVPWHLSYDGRFIVLPQSEELIMLSADQMGLPLSTVRSKMYLTFIGYQLSIYQQYRVEKVPTPSSI